MKNIKFFIPVLILFLGIAIPSFVTAYNGPSAFCFDQADCDNVACPTNLECLDDRPGCQVYCAGSGQVCPMDAACSLYSGIETQRCGYSANTPTCNISADPLTINQGQSSTLTWSSDGQSCTGSWAGSVPTSDSTTVSPSSTTTYTLTCTNNCLDSSASSNCSVTVNVISFRHENCCDNSGWNNVRRCAGCCGPAANCIGYDPSAIYYWHGSNQVWQCNYADNQNSRYNFVEDCDSYDGVYGSEYRNYYCSNGACAYTVVCTAPNPPDFFAPPLAWINYNPNFKATVSDPNNKNVRALFNITRIDTSPATPIDTNAVGSWVFAPYNTQSCYPTDCTSGRSLNNGEYSWNIKAQNSDGCESNWTAGRWLGIDKALPSGDINHSPASPDAGDLVTFSATGSDALSGVKSIQIYVDGVLRNTCNASTTCSYTGGPYSVGNHTYQAIITDNAINQAGANTNIYTTPLKSFSVAALGTTVTLSANPSYRCLNFTSTLTATVGGNTVGNIFYQFDCTNDGPFDYEITSANTTLPYSGCPAYTQNSQARVRVTREGLSAEATVNLYKSTFSVTPDPANILTTPPLNTQQFIATYDSDGPGGTNASVDVAGSSNCNWNSSNTSVAKIGPGLDCSNLNPLPAGQAQGCAAGTSTITATYVPAPGDSCTDTATLNVNQPKSNYKVIISGLNRPPTADTFNATPSDFCASTVIYSFSWRYFDQDGDFQSRFDFQVDDNSDFSSPAVSRSYGDWSPFNPLNNPSNTTNTQAVQIVPIDPPPANQITYGKTYYWQVRVWDINGANSGWLPQPPFSITASHRYPVCDFTRLPEYPNPTEDVQFTDNSICYDNIFSGSECSSTTGDTFSWTFNGGSPNTSDLESQIVVFNNFGTYDITLTVTDSGGYSCSATKQIKISFPLPKWKEIKP